MSLSIKSSSDLIGKRIRICFDSSTNDTDNANVLIVSIESMETDGILLKYYTEEDDSEQTCDSDDEGSVKTYTYVPWKCVRYIDYREDEKYPED
jgi:hypothetical protein